MGVLVLGQSPGAGADRALERAQMTADSDPSPPLGR